MYDGLRGCAVALLVFGLLACAAGDNRNAMPATAAGTEAAPVAMQSSPSAGVGGAGAQAVAGETASGGGRAEAGAMNAEPPPSAAGADGDLAGQPAAGRGGAGQPAADGGMAGASSSDSPFVLIPVGFPMAASELTFPESAYPPTNASPELMWTGAPKGSKSLAVVFRDLGNGAIKWMIWDIPPAVTRLPPNISKVAMPPEVPGSSQLGSLDNQGYAGPGSGARQYDFKLWALDIEKLPVSRGLTTAQIHADVLPAHEIAVTEPVLVRNTRNLP